MRKKDAMPFVKPSPYEIQCILSAVFSIHKLLDIVKFDRESQVGWNESVFNFCGHFFLHHSLPSRKKAQKGKKSTHFSLTLSCGIC